jgi:hypothetical protein
MSQAITATSDWLKAGGLSHDAAHCGSQGYIFLRAWIPLYDLINIFQMTFTA